MGGCVVQPPTAGGAQLCSPDITSGLEENKTTTNSNSVPTMAIIKYQYDSL